MENGFGKLLTQKRRFVFDTHPVRKYSITALDEVRQIFLCLERDLSQRSKWFGPKSLEATDIVLEAASNK